MAEITIERIALENLVINPQNPRHMPQASQLEALAAMVSNQGIKLVRLAYDIVDKGLNPSDVPLVTRRDDRSFTVLEGNRRIAALKLLASPSLLTSIDMPRGLTEQFRGIAKSAGDTLPKEINCVVLPEEDAKHWIHLKHTGENQGVGIVTWDGLASARFRGTSPSLQALDLIKDSPLIDDDTRKQLPNIAITNVERILGTPEARAALGLDVKNGHLTIVSSDEEGLGRLALVIADIVNRRIRVSDVDSKEQRVAYAQQIATKPLPTAAAPANGAPATQTGTNTPVRRIPPDRRTLIPRSCKLAILQPRINRIYHELLRLPVEDYVNCCAVMLRVFIELSIDHYAQANSVSLKKTAVGQPSKDMSLREKIGTVITHIDKNSILGTNELKGIRALHSNRDHILSVDSWNAYVHNKDYNPTANDLKANWDSIEAFVQALWR